MHCITCSARTLRTAVLLIAAVLLVGCKSGIRVGGPNIEGTYQLMWRDLPDGTKVEPPAINGMLTYTDTLRQFNVYWTEAAGKRVTISCMSEYELVDSRYWEQSIYYMINDETGAGMKYDLSRPGGAADVTVAKDGAISFQLPLFGEPAVVFNHHEMTATREGAFVDHWKKVD